MDITNMPSSQEEYEANNRSIKDKEALFDEAVLNGINIKDGMELVMGSGLTLQEVMEVFEYKRLNSPKYKEQMNDRQIKLKYIAENDKALRTYYKKNPKQCMEYDLWVTVTTLKALKGYLK